MKKRAKISEYLFFQEGPGVRNTQYTMDGVKLLNVSNLVDGEIDLSNSNRYISEDEAYGKYKHFLVDEGDLVIASSGIKVEYLDKKMGFIKKEHLPLCMNTSTIRFKSLDHDKLNIKYFKYYLQSNDFKRQVQKSITGSAQLNYGPSHLKEMTFLLYDLEFQETIVKTLNKLTDLIKKHNKIIEHLDTLIKARFVEMFGDEKTKGIFEDYVEISRGASPRPIASYITEEEDGINWIKIGDVTPNDIYIKKTEEKIKKEGADKSRYVKRGDFILSNSMSFGRPYILNIDGCVHDGWLIISHYNNNYEPIFLYYLIRSDKVQHQFRTSVEGAIVSNLNSDIVRNVKVILPDKSKQKKFVNFAEQIDKLKFDVQKSLEKTQMLFDSLMQEYFG